MTHLTPTWTGNLSDLDADQLAARGLAKWPQARVDVLNEMKRRNGDGS